MSFSGNGMEAFQYTALPVFGVKPSLIIRPRPMDDINTVDYDFGLADDRESTQAQIEEFRRQRR
jgi:hypothetical protein